MEYEVKTIRLFGQLLGAIVVLCSRGRRMPNAREHNNYARLFLSSCLHCLHCLLALLHSCVPHSSLSILNCAL